MKSFEFLHKQILRDLHTEMNQPVFKQILDAIQPHCESIVTYFYRELLNNTAAIKFLNHDAVKSQLRVALAEWLHNSFVYKPSSEEQEKYYQQQIRIGAIHARIDLPMALVNYGMSIIKTRVLQTLKNSNLTRDELADAATLVTQIIDWSLMIIDQSCEYEIIINEKNAQSLKTNISAQNLAFDYERLCTSLSEWMRNLLLLIAQNKYEAGVQSTIRHSNFGLWISHKAHLFLAGRPELTILVTLVDNIDDEMRQLVICMRQQNLSGIEETLISLNGYISKSIIVLGSIAKDMIDEDNGRDSLTHLFNCHYLETIMRHETKYSLEHGILFGVLIIDVDFFSRINDIFGRENGDKILGQLASILTQQVRAGDFVFRIGGEEFLIILADVNPQIIQRVSEKIRFKIQNHCFELTDTLQSSAVTVSIGTSIHDRHPDFNRTIVLAEKALCAAKKNGRNQVISSIQKPFTYAVL